MNVSFNKAAIAVATTFAVLVLTNAASAAISLGFPQGRPYYGAQHQRSATRSYYYSTPSYSTPMESTRQSFSYEPTETAPKSDSAQDVKINEPPTVRRSYSYEPATSAPRMGGAYRSWSPTKEPWQYQKTDPRRWGR